MAHIRKRTLPSGKVRWQLVWEARGKRISEMFETQREANAKRIAVEGSKPASSAPFRTMAADYVEYLAGLVETGELERSYVDSVRGHINNHIFPDKEFSDLRCSSIGTPEVQQFLIRLIGGMPAKSAAKIRTTLTGLFKHGVRTGFMTFNPVREAGVKQKKRPEAGQEAPFKLPPKSALRSLIKGAGTFDNTGRATAVVHTLMYGGLRMSELRGLERKACNLVGDATKMEVVQRADRYNKIGSVKSVAGRRTVDIGPGTAQALRLWLVAAPTVPAAQDGAVPPEFAFPNEAGGVWGYPNFRGRFWVPLMNHCGLVTDEPADAHIRGYVKANAEFRAPLFGPHMLRHVYASLQIEQGVTPKRLQKLIGHSTLKMTMDTYAHLWPDDDADRARARNVETML